MSHSGELPPRSDDIASRSPQQQEFEIEFFGRILERYPKHLDVLRRQTRLLSNAGMREAGLECNRRLASVLPHDPQVHYHLACSLAAVGEINEALQALQIAIDLGFRDFEHLEADPDLDSLRDHPRFQALLRIHGMES